MHNGLVFYYFKINNETEPVVGELEEYILLRAFNIVDTNIYPVFLCECCNHSGAISELSF